MLPVHVSYVLPINEAVRRCIRSASSEKGGEEGEGSFRSDDQTILVAEDADEEITCRVYSD